MKKNKIKKIDINMFPEDLISKSAYRTEVIKFVDHHPRGKEAGELAWNIKFPKGYEQWKDARTQLTASGAQMIIDKLNEIINILNKTN